MSLKKIGGYVGDVVGEFTGAADVERAGQAAAERAQQAAQQGITGVQQGFAGAEDRLQPFLMGGVQAQQRLMQELFGDATPTQQIPGYESMARAREQGIDTLAQGRAGMGTLFSGRTGQEAAEISGSMEQQLRDMFMGQLRQQAGQGANIGQFLGSGQMNTQQNIADLLMGSAGQQSQYELGAAQTSAQSMGDLIGAGAGLAGYMMGGRGNQLVGG